jgi:hypothetical protein
MIFQRLCRIIAMDAYLNVGALESMRPGIMRMKHKVHGDEEDVLQCRLV